MQSVINLIHQLVQRTPKKQDASVGPTDPCKAYIQSRRYSKRNQCIYLLNHVAQLRPIDIAALRICDVLGPDAQITKQLHLYSEHKNQPRHRLIYLDFQTRLAIKSYLLARFKSKTLDSILCGEIERPLFVTQKSAERGFTANTLAQYLHYLYRNTRCTH